MSDIKPRACLLSPLLLAGLLACGGEPTARPVTATPIVAAPPTASEPPAPRADGRLPALARPTFHELSLTLDPAAAGFSGTMTISLEVLKPTQHLVLNGDALVIDSARVDGRDAKVTLRPEQQEIVVSLDQELSGNVVLELNYHAEYSTGLEGLYSVKGAVYSDFEPVDARKAFPCFDDPAYKAPYRVRVRVPNGQVAFANAKEVARQPGETFTEFQFEPTRPLPAYLVAVAAGNLKVIEGPKGSRWPVRIIARPEALSEARARPAIDTTIATLDKLAEWFDLDYPYGKLDLVGVPDFGAGAMENAGLVTFREELLLIDPRTDSTRQRRSMELVVTHELAHQWFGDLVTTAWWDDIWLNEGFASFMEGEILDAVRPGFGAVLDRYVDAQRAMELDGLPSARSVRQPVHSASDAREAFDPITYDKGAMVLQMAQSWLGKESFRAAVARYVKKHADGNATAKDLFAELDAEGQIAGSSVSQVLSAYLDQPGVPWLGNQARGAWQPHGLDRTRQAHWPLVFCHAPKLCEVTPADKLPSEFPFASSYVRGTPELGAAASEADKLALLWNHWSTLRGGAPSAAALATWQKHSLTAVKSATTRHALESFGMQLARLLPAYVGTPQGEALLREVRRELSPLWKRGRGVDADDKALQRRALAHVLAGLAHDPQVQRELRTALDRALGGAVLSADENALAFELGSGNGDAALWDRLHARWSSSSSASERTLLLRSMLGFDDDAQLLRTLDLVLLGKLPQQDLRYVTGVLTARPDKVALLDAWTQKHWSKLSEILSPAVRTRFASVFGAMCKTAEIDAAKPFYTTQIAKLEGAKRNVELAEQGARVCAAQAPR